MGKLRKLRKEIEKDPTQWFYESSYGHPYRQGLFSVSKADYWRFAKSFKPNNSFFGKESYRAYIRHTLRRLGYPVVK